MIHSNEIPTHLKSTTFVGADLRARSGNVTLVDILACSVVNQFEAWSTFTIETSTNVDTKVRTSAIVNFAFVTSTFVNGLVFGVRTILNLITNLRQCNAHPTATIKLSFAVACTLWSRWAWRKRKKNENLWNEKRSKHKNCFWLAYGILSHHFHLYIQLCLNSGNDRRCMTYQRIEIDPLDMWRFDNSASLRHRLRDNLLCHHISSSCGYMWFHLCTCIPLERKSLAFCDDCCLSLCSSRKDKKISF